MTSYVKQENGQEWTGSGTMVHCIGLFMYMGHLQPKDTLIGGYSLVLVSQMWTMAIMSTLLLSHSFINLTHRVLYVSLTFTDHELTFPGGL